MNGTTPAIPTPKTRARFVLVLIAAACAVGGLVLAYRMTAWPKRFAVVQEGVLYRSEQPTVRQLQQMQAKLGLKTLLIVREGGGERVTDECRYAEKAGLRVVQIPIGSRRALLPQEIDEFFATVDDARRRPMLMHCAAGKHRTGLLVALYRVRRQGWPPAKAREELLSFGFDVEAHHELLEQFDELTKGVAPTQNSAGT